MGGGTGAGLAWWRMKTLEARVRSSCQLSLPLTHGGLAVGEVLCLLLSHHQFIEHTLCARYHAKDVKVNLALKTSSRNLWNDKCCGEGDSTSWFAWDSPCHPGVIIASIPFILQSFGLENK